MVSRTFNLLYSSIIETKIQSSYCVCLVFSSHSFWTSSSLEVPAWVTQEEGRTGFLIHLLSGVLGVMCGWCLAYCTGIVFNTVGESAMPDSKENKQGDAGSRCFQRHFLCVCVCFLPIHSGHQWAYQPGSHRRKVTQDFSSTFFLRCVP